MAAALAPKLGFFTLALFSFATPIYSVQDPSRIVPRALACFNTPLIYSSCGEDYRLHADGNINVPPEAVNSYCSGPCLQETGLVLNCVDAILGNFFFYNGATTKDVRTALLSGCSYSGNRGDFNVAEHILQQESDAKPLFNPPCLFLLTTVMAVAFSALLL